MKTTKLLALLFVIALMTSCNTQTVPPGAENGSQMTFTISEAPFDTSEPTQLGIEMGGGKLFLAGGTDKLVEGTVVVNHELQQPAAIRENNSLTLKQQRPDSTLSIPREKYINNWDIKVGTVPIDLSITAGAYEGVMELGGLALTNLTVADGASTSSIKFSHPNAAEMSLLSYKTGASTTKVEGLGNAHVETVDFTGGVGNFLFDFTGENLADMDVFIDSGMSSITIVIPANARSEITIAGDMNNVDISGTWTVDNNLYQSGSKGPLIKILLDVGFGDLKFVQK